MKPLSMILSMAAGLLILTACPPTPSITETPAVETPVNLKCEACVKDVPGCMNGLMNDGVPLCDALVKCENRTKCDSCVTIGYEPYITWRKFKLDGRACSQ